MDLRRPAGWNHWSPRQRLGGGLAVMAGALVLWACFWRVPTEVVGQGVLLPPDSAGLRQSVLGSWADDPRRQRQIDQLAATIEAWWRDRPAARSGAADRNGSSNFD